MLKLIIKVDEYALPAGLLRHFDLTSTPSTSRRENYPGGLLFIDRLLALAEIDGNFTEPKSSRSRSSWYQAHHFTPLPPQLDIGGSYMQSTLPHLTDWRKIVSITTSLKMVLPKMEIWWKMRTKGRGVDGLRKVDVWVKLGECLWMGIGLWIIDYGRWVVLPSSTSTLHERGKRGMFSK